MAYVSSSAYSVISRRRTPLPPTNRSSPSSFAASLASPSLPFARARTRTRTSRSSSNTMMTTAPTIKAEALTIEKSGIKIVRNPPDSKLADLGVRTWPKWGCPPSKFPWTYSAKETCYLLEGKVKVYPDGSDEGVEIGAGDLVVFPKGMSCTWDVSVGVDKHYKFE